MIFLRKFLLTSVNEDPEEASNKVNNSKNDQVRNQRFQDEDETIYQQDGSHNQVYMTVEAINKEREWSTAHAADALSQKGNGHLLLVSFKPFGQVRQRGRQD